MNGRDRIFAKSSRCDTSWQRAQVESLGCQAASPNREIPAMLIQPSVQNVPGKKGELSPSGTVLTTPTGKRPKVCPRTRWCDYISNLARPVLVWSQQNYLRLPGLSMGMSFLTSHGMGQHTFVFPMRLRNRMRESEWYWIVMLRLYFWILKSINFVVLHVSLYM